MELQRFQQRYHCELLRIGVLYTAINANANANANTGSCHRRWWRHSATDDYATDDYATHGDNVGEPDQHNVRQSLDRDLVLDQCNLMHRLGRVGRDEADQRHAGGIADKHDDLHADLHRKQRYVRSSQYDGNGERRPGAGQRRVRIGEWHDGIVCTFDQPLLRRYGVVRGRLGPVDMELQRF